MTAIVRFDTWADIGLRGADLEPNRTPRGIAIHYPGPGRFAFADHARCREQVRAWDAQHRAGGSRMLEYGAILCTHRVLMEGRNRRADFLTRVGSNGTLASNSSHQSVQLMRGTQDTPPTDLELRALGEWVRFGRAQGMGPEVKGHRDFYATACPGDYLYQRLDLIARYAADTEEPPVRKFRPYADTVDLDTRDVPRGREVTLGTLDTREHRGFALQHLAQLSFEFAAGEPRPDTITVKFVRMPAQDGTGVGDYYVPRTGRFRLVHSHTFTGGQKVDVRVTIPGKGAPVRLRYGYLKASRFMRVPA